MPKRRINLWRIAASVALALGLVVAGSTLWFVFYPRGARPTQIEPSQPSQSTERGATADNRGLVRLSVDEQKQIGVATESLKVGPHREEFRAYGTVLDLARITDLTNSYATAKAQLETAQAKLEVSKGAAQRAKALGQYSTAVQVETTESTARSDQAALASAESQLRTLAATARQEWGPILGKAIVERSATATRLIEREQLLVQVTLQPGVSLANPPETTYAEVPTKSPRAELRFVSPATRTDPRVQGLSYFYTVPGDGGLLPGMSISVFVPSETVVDGVVVQDTAVVRWQGSSWVYLQVADDAFARHRIATDLPTSDDDYIVQSIPRDRPVVVRGAQALLSEETKNELRGGAGADAD